MASSRSPPASIVAACRAAGHAWRDRKLRPVATVHLFLQFLLPVLSFSTAMTHPRHLAGGAVTASAYRMVKSKTEAGARKELASHYLVYNFVPAVRVKAATRQGMTPDRVGFPR